MMFIAQLFTLGVEMKRIQYFLLLVILILHLGCSGDDVIVHDVQYSPDSQIPSDIKNLEVEDSFFTEKTTPPPCEPNQPCDDLDPCTINDMCGEDGVCKGQEVEGCSDQIECTFDSCVALGQCSHILVPGWCLIDGKCFYEGTPDPQNPCKSCITSVSTDQFVPDDTLTCDDHNECTKGDHCKDGECVATLISCDDQNPCTDDACVDGKCTNTPINGLCSDGNLCTIDDKCSNGICQGTPLVCNDNNPCTNDSCDPDFGCIFEPNDEPCDDGNICTVGDRCDGGVCRGGKDLLSCEDQNPCTDDVCVPSKGCVHIPNNAPCDDGDPCTLGDVCKKGVCLPGNLPAICDDNNPCTDDICKKGIGCVYLPNSAPCDDGEPCFQNDHCQDGKCVPGIVPLKCDDSNPCTDDVCEKGVGCVYTNNSASCDDGNVCTKKDVCNDGICIGTDIQSCDDGESCTSDWCDPKQGCLHEPINKVECRPQIIIEYPPRGATLNGQSDIEVKGKIQYGKAGWPVGMVYVNGTPHLVDPISKSFTHKMKSVQGINIIQVDVEDIYGLKDHVVQSYYYSTVWYPPNDPVKSYVKDGLMVYLGQEVWDDNDRSDVDDIATIMLLYVKSMDIAGLIKNPITSGKFGWCDYKVNVSNITYGEISLNLKPISGGLHMKAVIPNFKADVKVDLSGFLCDIADMSGDVKASSITIETDLIISVDASGELVVNAKNVNVTISGLNITIKGIWGFLLNWLINFFEGTFTKMIEEQFEKQIKAQIEDAVSKALKGLALDQKFEIPPMFEGAKPMTLSVKTKISSVAFSPDGGTIGFSATISVPKNVGYNPLGSIGRASCLKPQPDPLLSFPKKGTFEMGLHDDFLNQIPFSMYWGGGLTFPIPESMLAGQDLSQYGIDNLNLDVDFMLPPIITACTPNNKMNVQIGDMKIHAKMKLFGKDVDMILYTSMIVEANITAVDTDKGKQLTISVEKPSFLDVEIASLAGGLEGAEDSMRKLMLEQMMPKIMDGFTGKALGTFPIPEIDLSAINPSVPKGSKISIDLKELLRIFGYTVMSGKVKQVK